jgi:hypothetical protein
MENNMACRVCASQNVQETEGELTASFPGIADAPVAPVYVCQRVLVCLDCGFAELVIPTIELDQFRKRKTASGS